MPHEWWTGWGSRRVVIYTSHTRPHLCSQSSELSRTFVISHSSLPPLQLCSPEELLCIVFHTETKRPSSSSSCVLQLFVVTTRHMKYFLDFFYPRPRLLSPVWLFSLTVAFEFSSTRPILHHTPVSMSDSCWTWTRKDEDWQRWAYKSLMRVSSLKLQVLSYCGENHASQVMAQVKQVTLNTSSNSFSLIILLFHNWVKGKT